MHDRKTRGYLGKVGSEISARSLRVLLLGAILIAAQPAMAAEPVTALKAGHVFNSRTGLIGGPQTILIKGGKIVAMGPALSIPEGAPTIDLSRYTVMPGLIESHAHLLQEHPGDEENTITVTKAVAMEGDALRALRGAARARS